MDTRNLVTFQDFESSTSKEDIIVRALAQYHLTEDFDTAMTADLYDRRRNKTINEYVQVLYSITGSELVDFTASNSKLPSNFFHRLNTQRNMYSLGNGISFTGSSIGDNSTKHKLGDDFDHQIKRAAYCALIHGVSYCFWNVDRLFVFPMTEFMPFWDEETGELRAGVRFWRIGPDKPMMVVLYEEDGYTKYKTDGGRDSNLELVKPKHAYKERILYTPADDYEEVVGFENYSKLPIIPMYGSELKQSTLVGMRQQIDSYDLIQSGFANDLTDCSQIYWLVSNYGGMSDEELGKFRDRLKLNHIALVDIDSGGGVTPYTQEVPYQARQTYLENIRKQIYNDFGGLDVHTIMADATNDHIDAAYQPMDEEAADFEYCVSETIKQILKLQGIEDTPVFQRARISNTVEQVDNLMKSAQYLDEETIVSKLPFLSPDEVEEVLKRKAAEKAENEKFQQEQFGTSDDDSQDGGDSDGQQEDGNQPAQPDVADGTQAS